MKPPFASRTDLPAWLGSWTPPADSALGTESGGVWTRDDAVTALGPHTVQHRLEGGLWQVVLPGVYADAGFDRDLLMTAWATSLAGGNAAVVCGRTAARLWDLPLIDDDDPATGAHQAGDHDVATRRHHTGAVAGEGLTVHRRQLSLRPEDIVTHSSGLRLTTPLRTVRDLAAQLTPQALVCVLDHALRTGLVDAAALEEELARAKGSRQGPALAAAVALADGSAESPGETLARLLLKPHLPALLSQVRVHDRRGELVAVLDFALDELRLAVEVDGKRNHAGELMVAKDRRRDAATRALGWRTERVTWWELRCRPVAFVSRVLQRAAELRRRAG